jgi:WD40 repeat protein
VTCIQFNPVDEFYFLSGALDDKVRIWSIADHQVVDWTDLGEMVTAVCYTPDGKRAIVGSYKGTCRYFNTAGLKSSYQFFEFQPCSNSDVVYCIIASMLLCQIIGMNLMLNNHTIDSPYLHFDASQISLPL